MTTVAELKAAILNLSEAEYTELHRWLFDYDWERWEREFEEDVLAGKLDFLKAEALEAKENRCTRGTCRYGTGTAPSPLRERVGGEGDDSSIQSKRAEKAVHGRGAPSLVETSQPETHGASSSDARSLSGDTSQTSFVESAISLRRDRWRTPPGATSVRHNSGQTCLSSRGFTVIRYWNNRGP